MSVTRRLFTAALAGAPAFRLFGAEPQGWAMAEEILKRIKAPVFAKRDFVITKFGAKAGGDASEAIKKAIAACVKAGGGRVVVPAGEYLTGPVHLDSNVNFHVAKGATLKWVTDAARYLPVVMTRWEGTELMSYSPFIYAYGKKNVAVTGEGTLDGQANCTHWWPWSGKGGCGYEKGQPSQAKARNALVEMGAKDVPVKERVFAEGSLLRPQFIQMYSCQNVLVEGVTILNSPMWEIHPVLCKNVTVRGVRIDTHGPNNDGCDPESCTDVLIEDCIFDTGDDCIAIKSGRNRDGRRVNVPTENVIVRNCIMKDGHGGVTIGSEVSGGCRNVFIEKCKMDSPHLDRILRLKTNSVRGGFIENVWLRDVEGGQVADAAIHADLFYEEGDKGEFPPRVEGIHVERLTVKKMKSVLYLRGYKNAPIRNIEVKDSTFETAARADTLENVEGLKLVNVKIAGQTVQK